MKRSVLIIDDSETDRYLLRRSLQKSEMIGHIFEMENGQDAFNFLSDFEAKKKEYSDVFPPCIIFLDINMPHVDGFEFLKLFNDLRNKREDYKRSILFMFSSSDHVEDKDKALAYDFVDDFIVKGNFGPKTLREKVENVLIAKSK